MKYLYSISIKIAIMIKLTKPAMKPAENILIKSSFLLEASISFNQGKRNNATESILKYPRLLNRIQVAVNRF